MSVFVIVVSTAFSSPKSTPAPAAGNNAPQNANPPRSTSAPRNTYAPPKNYEPRNAYVPRDTYVPRNHNAPHKTYQPRATYTPRNAYTPRNPSVPHKDHVSRSGNVTRSVSSPNTSDVRRNPFSRNNSSTQRSGSGSPPQNASAPSKTFVPNDTANANAPATILKPVFPTGSAKTQPVQTFSRAGSGSSIKSVSTSIHAETATIQAPQTVSGTMFTYQYVDKSGNLATIQASSATEAEAKIIGLADPHSGVMLVTSPSGTNSNSIWQGTTQSPSQSVITTANTVFPTNTVATSVPVSQATNPVYPGNPVISNSPVTPQNTPPRSNAVTASLPTAQSPRDSTSAAATGSNTGLASSATASVPNQAAPPNSATLSTYQYVDKSGSLATIQASSASEAQSKIVGLADPHSGVMLATSPNTGGNTISPSNIQPSSQHVTTSVAVRPPDTVRPDNNVIWNVTLSPPVTNPTSAPPSSSNPGPATISSTMTSSQAAPNNFPTLSTYQYVDRSGSLATIQASSASEAQSKIVGLADPHSGVLLVTGPSTASVNTEPSNSMQASSQPVWTNAPPPPAPSDGSNSGSAPAAAITSSQSSPSNPGSLSVYQYVDKSGRLATIQASSANEAESKIVGLADPHSGVMLVTAANGAPFSSVTPVVPSQDYVANPGGLKPSRMTPVVSSQTYVPQQTYNGPSQSDVPQQTYHGPPQGYLPQQGYNEPSQTYAPRQTYNGPMQMYVPQQTYNGPSQTYVPQQTYNGPSQTYVPQQTYSGPSQTYVPQQTYNGPSQIQAPQRSYNDPSQVAVADGPRSTPSSMALMIPSQGYVANLGSTSPPSAPYTTGISPDAVYGLAANVVNRAAEDAVEHATQKYVFGNSLVDYLTNNGVQRAGETAAQAEAFYNTVHNTASQAHDVFSAASDELADRGYTPAQIANAYSNIGDNLKYAIANPDQAVTSLKEGFDSSTAVALNLASNFSTKGYLKTDFTGQAIGNFTTWLASDQVIDAWKNAPSNLGWLLLDSSGQRWQGFGGELNSSLDTFINAAGGE